MILHEVGGFYADLDMECLQPLTYLSEKYSCFLSEESYEHVNLLYHMRDSVVITCVMGCRAGHPFYKDLVDELPSRSKINGVINGTGPVFVTSMFEEFKKKPGIPLEDHIELLPPKYLVPVSDLRALRVERICQILEARLKQNFNITIGLHNRKNTGHSMYNPSRDKTQDDREAEICRTMNRLEKFSDAPVPESLTTHHWAHSWDDALKELWAKKPRVNIKTVVPHLKLYSNILDGTDSSLYYDPK